MLAQVIGVTVLEVALGALIWLLASIPVALIVGRLFALGSRHGCCCDPRFLGVAHDLDCPVHGLRASLGLCDKVGVGRDAASPGGRPAALPERFATTRGAADADTPRRSAEG